MSETRPDHPDVDPDVELNPEDGTDEEEDVTEVEETKTTRQTRIEP